MKKLFIKIVTVLLTFTFFSLNAGAENNGSFWYIKRQGNNTPIFPPDSEALNKLDVYYIDKKAAAEGEKIIYLTFDAGYENGNIAKILNTLEEKNVPAAFFILDNLIYKNSTLIAKIIEDGHEVCNHTCKHKNHSNSSKAEIQADLMALEKLYLEKSGNEMDKFFRFPEGCYTEQGIEAVKELGYSTVFWSFGYEDWNNERQPAENYAINKILSNTHPGEILLLHPTSETNAKILPALIDKWKEMGYRFGTLKELKERNTL